jgi:hypothetical protein
MQGQRLTVEWSTQDETSLEQKHDTLCDLGSMDYKLGYICDTRGINKCSIWLEE